MPSHARPPLLPAQLGDLGTDGAFEVLARARALEATGQRVVHLEIGEPDFETPPHIVEAAAKALRDGETRYCAPEGLPELRAACAEHLSRRRGISLGPDRVVIGPGLKPLLYFGILATCERGDEVVYPDPGFPIYESLIRWVGATPVPLPVVEERAFAFSAEDLARRLNSRTKLVILNSPANPTGGVIDDSLNQEIAAVLVEHSCWVISDEIYSEIVYEGEHDSIAAHEDLLERTLLLDGFSKAFAMTGWRLGYAALPQVLVEPVGRLFVNSFSCAAPAIQRAGIAALTGPRDAVVAMVDEFHRRRDVLVRGLNELPGIFCVVPQGAFYAFPNITGTGQTAAELADRMLHDAGVALLPGTAFGAHGEGHLRLSYANTLENIEVALASLQDFLERTA
jgi:aspartate/methionine/tyrosine aminotransferase